MLELKNISKTFHPGTVNAKTALRDLSLTLNDGDFVTVIGGNGAGKSTCSTPYAGVFPVDCGSIRIDGGTSPAAGAQARRLHRPRVPGPDDGHRRHHGH